MWFRRDLRLRDNPALLAAIAAARNDGDGQVIPTFIVDPVLWNAAGAVRRDYLARALGALDRSVGGQLLVKAGDPATILAALARENGATSVHIAADFGPHGRARDEAVDAALGRGVLVRTGSPYAVAPGRVTKGDGTPYRIYTPFYRAWLQHGWRAPAGDIPGDVHWLRPTDHETLPESPGISPIAAMPAGEEAAWHRWDEFRANGLADYLLNRDRPDLAGTSALGHHLKWGEIHPRSLLAELGDKDEVYRKELCWREFYADVLTQRPDTARFSLDRRFDEAMRWSSGEQSDTSFAAWAEGRTGYPFVDAGMRQLRAEGWMHNRVRMVVASFLVKDLHLPWQRGAREFMLWLRDGDLASNSHGWQWAAGSGTDASPFYRVFNPVGQGLKFDPNGEYVRRYVPELAHLVGKSAHEPWEALDGYSHGYARRIVDHKEEREIALADYAAIKRG